MPDPAGLAEVWRHEAPRMLGVATSFHDSDLEFRPGRSGRTVGDLLAYIADSCDLTRHWLLHDTAPPDRQPARCASVLGATEVIELAQASLFATLDRLQPERFFDVIAPFGQAEHRGVMALGMLKHELHYRGELYALAAMCGRRPPALYS